LITLIGDIHGDFLALMKIVRNQRRASAIIQVGDFGYWPGFQSRYVPPLYPVYFLDGNHDDVGALVGESPYEWDKPVELWPNAIYVPRGTVLEVEKTHVLCLGGAKSVDRKYRPKEHGTNAWFEEEVIRESDAVRAVTNSIGKKIDLMVTHTPPKWMVDKYFGFPNGWDLPSTWNDPSTTHVEDVWKALDCPPLVCGHMHESITDGVCRILDTNEVFEWDG
jgi:predicted phosphodiesterase